MTIGQQLLKYWRVLLKHTLNPLSRRTAYSSASPFAIVRHVGRRSGKPYETPIVVQPVAGGFVFELTYGTDADWYKNIVAVGGCTVHWHGRDYMINRIEPLDTETGLSAFPLIERVVLRALRRKHFFKMIEATTQA